MSRHLLQQTRQETDHLRERERMPEAEGAHLRRTERKRRKRKRREKSMGARARKQSGKETRIISMTTAAAREGCRLREREDAGKGMGW